MSILYIWTIHRQVLPKKILISFGLLIFILLLGWVLYPLSSDLIIKATLNPPKESFKDISKVKGIAATAISTVSGKIKYPHDYTIVLLGDSMTERLGNSIELKGYLNEYYPDQTFEVLNYGYGATNVLSAKERLSTQTENFRDFRPILEIDFDLLLIESFGNNPLSEFDLDDGLNKQVQALDEMMQLVDNAGKKDNVVFVTTISPNTKNYAKSQVDLSDEKRKQWVSEREAYIQNHIKYAKNHGIPLIDVYHKSKDFFGDGKTIYIDQEDNIHPSPTGILLISQEIANQVYQQKLLRARPQITS